MDYLRWFTACVPDCDTFGCIVILCFGPWFLWIFVECFEPWRYCVLVYEILQLLQVGTCWAKNWSVVMKNPGEMYCWNDQVTKFVTRIWDQSMVLFRVLKFLQGIMEGPLCWEDKKCIRMVPWCKMANHAKIVREI